MKKDLVSIIMPAYNVEEYIANSIKSVLQQTYPYWELIIIEDKSTDNTLRVIDSFKDSRIKLIKNRENLGAALSRNLGIKIANGKYVAFLDGDDMWLPEKLNKQLEFMNKNDYSFSYTNYQEMTEEGELKKVYWTGPKTVTKSKLFNYDYIGCLTMVYNQERLGKFEIINLKKRNDYALKLKIIKESDCHLLDEILAIYRKRESKSISSRENGKIKLIKYYYIMYRESETYNTILSLLSTTRNCIFGIIKKIFYKRKIKYYTI